MEAVNLVLAGCPVDTRIHFNPNNRMGGRKLKSNFKSIKIEILPQYNSNIFTLGVLPKKNSYPTVTTALWHVMSNQEAPVGVHLPYLHLPSLQQGEIQGSVGDSTSARTPAIAPKDPTAACWQETSFHDVTGKELPIRQSKRYWNTFLLTLAYGPRIPVREYSPTR